MDGSSHYSWNESPAAFHKNLMSRIDMMYWRSHHSVCIFIGKRDLMRLGRSSLSSSNRENPMLTMQLCLHKLHEAFKADEMMLGSKVC